MSATTEKVIGPTPQEAAELNSADASSGWENKAISFISTKKGKAAAGIFGGLSLFGGPAVVDAVVETVDDTAQSAMHIDVSSVTSFLDIDLVKKAYADPIPGAQPNPVPIGVPPVTTGGNPNPNFMGGAPNVPATGPQHTPITSPHTGQPAPQNPVVIPHSVPRPPEQPPVIPPSRPPELPPVYQPPVYQPPVYQPPVYQPPTRFDMCVNIADIQDYVPAGLTRRVLLDGVSGICEVPPPPAPPVVIVEKPPVYVAPKKPVYEAPKVVIPTTCPIPQADGTFKDVPLPEEFRAKLVGLDQQKIQAMLAEFKCEFLDHDAKQTIQHDEIKKQITEHDNKMDQQHNAQSEALGIDANGDGKTGFPDGAPSLKDAIGVKKDGRSIADRLDDIKNQGRKINWMDWLQVAAPFGAVGIYALSRRRRPDVVIAGDNNDDGNGNQPQDRQPVNPQDGGNIGVVVAPAQRGERIRYMDPEANVIEGEVVRYGQTQPDAQGRYHRVTYVRDAQGIEHPLYDQNIEAARRQMGAAEANAALIAGRARDGQVARNGNERNNQVELNEGQQEALVDFLISFMGVALRDMNDQQLNNVAEQLGAGRVESMRGILMTLGVSADRLRTNAAVLRTFDSFVQALPENVREDLEQRALERRAEIDAQRQAENEQQQTPRRPRRATPANNQPVAQPRARRTPNAQDGVNVVAERNRGQAVRRAGANVPQGRYDAPRTQETVPTVARLELGGGRRVTVSEGRSFMSNNGIVTVVEVSEDKQTFRIQRGNRQPSTITRDQMAEIVRQNDVATAALRQNQAPAAQA